MESNYRPTPDADPRRIYHNILVGIDPKRGLNNGQPTGVISWFDTIEPRIGVNRPGIPGGSIA
jgi:protein-L-isoaspartate(D-aspartate) O-methyltransferase